jgi:cell division protein FtsQ
MGAGAVSDLQLAASSVPAKPQRRGRIWLALLALAALCAFAVYHSALFRLASVQVTGATRLTQQQVMELAGLAPGVPRWEHPASNIEARLKQEPWVQAASASWQGTRVVIDLKERVAVGLLRYGDLFYLALDDSGRILEQVDLKSAQGLPVVSGVVITKAVRGQQLQHQGLLDALTLLSRMPQPLRGQVSELQVAADRALTLFMARGATVQVGLVPDLEKDRLTSVDEKVKLLELYWREAPKKRLTACNIDLRVQGLVIPSAGCK